MRASHCAQPQPHGDAAGSSRRCLPGRDSGASGESPQAKTRGRGAPCEPAASPVPWKRVYLILLIGVRKGVDGMFTFAGNFIFREVRFSSTCGPAVHRGGRAPAVIGAPPDGADDAALADAVCDRCPPDAPERRFHFSALSASLSARAEYALVCDADYVVAVALAAYMAGMAIGATVTGRLVSPYGRRFFGRYVSTAMIVGPAFLMAVTNSAHGLIACNLVLGAGVGVGVIANYLILIELFAESPVWRARATMIVFVVWSLVVSLISPIAYVLDTTLPNLPWLSTSLLAGGLREVLPHVTAGGVSVVSAWRSLLLAMVLVELAVNYVYFVYVPESPVWLKAVGRLSEHTAIRRALGIADVPGVGRADAPECLAAAEAPEEDDPDAAANEASFLLQQTASADAAAQEELGRAAAAAAPPTAASPSRRPGKAREADRQSSYRLLFSCRARHHGRPILVISALMLCSWFAIALTYYGMILNASVFGPNIYVGVGVSALEQSLGYWIADPMMNSRLLGRRYTMALCFLVSGGSFWGIAALPPAAEGAGLGAPGALALVSMLFISCAFGVIYPYTAELFPLHIRGDGLGLGILFSRAGSIVAPILIQISKRADAEASRGMDASSAVVFGASCLLAAASNVLLPETRHTMLEEEDGGGAAGDGAAAADGEEGG